MSTPDTKADVRNYLRQLGREIYSEQSPDTRRRIDNITGRVSNITKRLNAGQAQGVPMTKEYIKRHLLGGANSVAGVLDGAAGEKIVKKRRTQQKGKSRKSRVVK